MNYKKLFIALLTIGIMLFGSMDGAFAGPHRHGHGNHRHH